MAASQGTMNNLTFGNAKHQYYETLCGGTGAGYNFNGADAIHSHMTNSFLTDPEILESRFPVRLLEFSIRPGSGGKGLFSGGNGVTRKIEFLETMTVNMISNHRNTNPPGLNGGQAGKTGSNWIIRHDDQKELYDACFKAHVSFGDILIINTPGGGGFGRSQT